MDVVEAAYEPRADEKSWLLGLIEAARPLVPGTDGCFAVTVKLDASGGVRFGEFGLPGNDDAFREMVTRITPELSRTDLQCTYFSPLSFETISERFGGRRVFESHWVTAMFRKFGWADFECLRAFDPDGNVVFIGWGRQSIRRVTRRESATWARVAAHVAAGRRLRSALDGVRVSRLEDPAVEAILCPDGNVQHARGPATHKDVRARLREAVRGAEAARSSLRYEPEKALEAWRGLVAGRWSLIDVFDHDGRRFLVARPNESLTSTPLALSPRERQMLAYVALRYTNRLIAYHLGLAESTVAETVKRALLKLGVSSRMEIAKMFGGGV